MNSFYANLKHIIAGELGEAFYTRLIQFEEEIFLILLKNLILNLGSP